MSGETPNYARPIEFLQNLIRFDTTNPPGNEAECIAYIKGLLDDAGIDNTILAKDELRPNLIARLKGRGTAPPLLMYGHVDVVTTEDQGWTHPPFDAAIQDGFLWGRGTIDMKGGVTQMLAAFLRAHAEQTNLPGDVILMIVSDEEVLGEYGAGYLAEEHAELFKDVRYALGEAGGFSVNFMGKRIYPIMVAEKQVCWLRATIHGPDGHASMPIADSALNRAGTYIHRLAEQGLPPHIIPELRLMIDALSDILPFPQKQLLPLLAKPRIASKLVTRLGEQARAVEPMLHNTVAPTIIRAGHQINVIPSTVTFELDCRLLPGFTKEDLLSEIHAVVKPNYEIEYEVLDYCVYQTNVDMDFFNVLSESLCEEDREAVAVPYIMAGITDGRFLSQLGIQTYGFVPLMQSPSGFNPINLMHAADERIPVDALEFGVNTLYNVLQRFGEVS